jgi:L-asparagine transporter-like permease
MIAMGCAIGTGLFLGSGLAISTAGPSVLISYAIGAFIVLLLMGCLAEMTVAHPTSGSFGTIAEKYISPFAGFVVRYSYWIANVLAIGVEVSAISVYMKYWFPDVPGSVWIFLFAALLIYVNATSVNTFGNFEYIFSMIKISAIVIFILLGAYVVIGAEPSSGIGAENYGILCLWVWALVAIFISLFSFLGTELIAVTAGEAKDPDIAVPKALKATVFRLATFYVLTIGIMLMIVPWQSAGIEKSPFVRVMEILNIPGASGIMNFIILTAALSAMNSQLYASTRMIFSLSEQSISHFKKQQRSSDKSPSHIHFGHFCCRSKGPVDYLMALMDIDVQPFNLVHGVHLIYISGRVERSGGVNYRSKCTAFI